MSQPASYGVRTSGPASMAEVAGDANDTLNAFLSMHKSGSAPSYKVAGTIWLDDSTTPWTAKVYDGAVWRTLWSVDPTTGDTILAGGLIRFPAAPTPSSDGNVLDFFNDAMAWTPTLAFGGASTGITYSSGGTSGIAIKIGRQVWIAGSITLTSKGTATGSATIGGLPYAAPYAAPLVVGNYFGMASINNLIGFASGSSVTLRNGGATSAANLTDANFTGTAGVLFSCTYQAAS